MKEKKRNKAEEAKERYARKAAEAIAERLFRNGAGDVADRLVLHDARNRDLGGWCKAAAINQIVDVLLTPA